MKREIYLSLAAIVTAATLCACGGSKDAVNEHTEVSGEGQEEAVEALEDKEEPAGAEVKGTFPEEATDEFLISVAGDSAPDIDISGCDTFTQIVDKKLSEGMGYANETIGGEDALLVCSFTYDNLDGNMAAIDAAVFMYKDGMPYEAGKVCCGGTAYPLAVKDGVLYAGSNHWIYTCTIENDALVITRKAAVEYDGDGNGTYYYESADGKDKEYATAKAEEMFNSMFEEKDAGKIINFQPVGGEASKETGALPAYEYPGPEAFYSVLYKYMIDEFGAGYEPADVCIPCPIIIAEDESDHDDIRVWADFQIYNYSLNGDTLETQSGGSYPGCMHLKSTDDAAGYEVTGMDLVGDGSDYDPTAKKIFGKYYEEFVKSSANEKGREATRAQIIANYAAANNLDIKAYKDYGWDPVSLPEENIDNFYSILE